MVTDIDAIIHAKRANTVNNRYNMLVNDGYR